MVPPSENIVYLAKSMMSRLKSLVHTDGPHVSLGILPVLFVELIVIANFGVISLSPDDHSRVMHAAGWARAPLILGSSDVWLPGHAQILGLALLLHEDLLVTPRVVTLVLSSITLLWVYLIGRQLFNKWVASLSVLLAGLLPPVMHVALTPLSETLYFAYIFGFLFLFIRWLDRGQDRWLLLSAVFLALSTTTRYEGWLTAAVFGLYLVHHSIVEFRRKKLLPWFEVSMLGLVSAFPFAWIIKSYLAHADALHVVQKTFPGMQERTGLLTSLSPKLGYIELLLESGALICAVAFVGILLLHPLPKIMRWHVALSLGPLLLLTFFMKSPELWAAYKPRYVAQYLISVTPFCAYTIYCAIRYKQQARPEALSRAVPILISLYNASLIYLRLEGVGWIVLTLLCTGGLIVSHLILRWKDWLFFSSTITPLFAFIAASRLELIGLDRIRTYLAFYLVLMLLSYGFWIWRTRDRTWSISPWRMKLGGVGILVILASYNLWGDFSGIPIDPGVKVGMKVRHLFQTALLRDREKVLLEVEGWNYLPIQVMSNHPQNFIFDRLPDGSRKSSDRDSFLLNERRRPYEVETSLLTYREQTGHGPPSDLDSYLERESVRLVLVKHPKLRALFGGQPGFVCINEVAGYRFFYKNAGSPIRPIS